MKNNRSSPISLNEIEDLLAGYGQDFATRGMPPNIQPWASLEIAVVLLAIFAWFAKTVLKTTIEQIVKNRMSEKQAQAKLSKLEGQISFLQREIEYLLSMNHKSDERLFELEQVCTDIATSANDKDDQTTVVCLSEESMMELAEILNELGLTRRKANRLAGLLKKPLLKLLKNP